MEIRRRVEYSAVCGNASRVEALAKRVALHGRECAAREVTIVDRLRFLSLPNLVVTGVAIVGFAGGATWLRATNGGADATGLRQSDRAGGFPNRDALALAANPPVVPCDCESDKAECDDDDTNAIFSIVPAYMDTLAMRYFVCSLSDDEREVLLNDVQKYLPEISAVSKAEFEGHMEDLDEVLDDQMAGNGFEGENAYLFLYGNFLRGLWYGYMDDLEQ